MAEHNRGRHSGNGDGANTAPASTTADVLADLLRQQRGFGGDDSVNNPELEQLIGSFKQGSEISIGPKAAVAPLTLEDLAAQTSIVALAEVPAVASKARRQKSSAPRGAVSAEADTAVRRDSKPAFRLMLFLVLLGGLTAVAYTEWPWWRPVLAKIGSEALATYLSPKVPKPEAGRVAQAPPQSRMPSAAAAEKTAPQSAAPERPAKHVEPVVVLPRPRPATVRQPLAKPVPLPSATSAEEIPLPPQPAGTEASAESRHVLPPAVAQSRLVREVAPEYPMIARAGRVQGSVVLHAMVGKDGSVEELRATSGNPLLIAPAINAVKQWRYLPYLVNGEAVDFETTVTVKFKGE